MEKTQKTALVAMSGGVDSSVAALLMKKQGYRVIGCFMKNWSDSKNDIGECTWKGERKSALKIASMLDIPLITLDFEKQYKKLVVEEMLKSYKKGITPNPDIDCNEKVKFPLLIQAMKKLKSDYLVTGHYSRISQNKKTKRYELHRAQDESKDQSYFLYRLSQEDLKNTLFPIGQYTKAQIREIAQKNNFPNYNKKSTVGICFIGKVNLKRFLQHSGIRPKKGKILSPEGKQIGIHDGIYYYTIGQRIGPRYGIDISKSNDDPHFNKKWYIASKNLKTNTIIAAPIGHPALLKKDLTLKEFYLIDESQDKYKNKPIKVLTRIRQVGELLPSTLTFNKKSKQFQIKIQKAITGVSEGQAAVLYQGSKVLGGGVIAS